MKQFLILTLLMAFVFTTNAQEFSLKEAQKGMSDGVHNALVIELTGISEKDAIDIWKNFFKDYKSKPKKVKRSDDWMCDDAQIKTISDNTIDVYANFEGVKANTVVSVWFNLGGAYVSSSLNQDQFQAAANFMRSYRMKIDQFAAEADLVEQEKIMKDMEKDLKKLEKDKEDYEKKIEEAKALIAEMENNIKQNGEEQVSKKAEIEAQSKVVENAKQEVKKYN
ncbi:MAG: hypothetical protein AAFO07_15380 [Bacteroidota bacterium]